jgi:WD40 repeat protein
LQKKVGDDLPALHGHLLDAYALTRWADLLADEPYLWDHLAEHLVEASRVEELVTTVKDLRYLAHKTLVRTVYATEIDLTFAEQRAPDDVPLRLLKRNFANMSHLLNRCSTYSEIAAVLYSRLVHLQELSDLCLEFEPDIPRPYLASWHLLPDLPDPALILTLSGHTNQVTGSAISPTGDFIVSASDDRTLKVWDVRMGAEQITPRAHSERVYGCAMSRSGDVLVSASYDQTLKIWNTQTGACLSTLYVNGWLHSCAFHPDGEHLVAVGAGGVYFLRWVR